MVPPGRAGRNVYLIFEGQIFPLVKEVVKLGRKLDNDIVLQDSLVSRYHAEIRYEDGKYMLYDMNSTGGTLLNNQSVETSELTSGDIIMLARVPVMFMQESSIINHKTSVTTDAIDYQKYANINGEEDELDDTTSPFEEGEEGEHKEE